MKTIKKQLEIERKLFQRGYNSCKEDVLEVIDEMPFQWVKDCINREELKNRIKGEK